LAGLGACAPAPQVWFAPNLGSPDLVDLFTRPEAWPRARARIDVFKFYAAQLLDPEVACDACGPNRAAALARAQAFGRLHEWRIDVAIEVGAIKSWDCRAEITAPLARAAAQRVRELGGNVRYLALDEPLFGGLQCGLDSQESARRTAAFVRALRAESPELEIGDIEPYPVISAEGLDSWLNSLRREGASPAFFHLDVDRARAAQLLSDVAVDLQALRSACRSAGIPFGVILWSDDASSDRAYSEDALRWTQTVAEALDGSPQHTLFQSWAASPDGAQRLPTNLPEDDPAVYSHTRLINDGVTLLQARDRARLLAGR
jgi:hypothetical protein